MIDLRKNAEAAASVRLMKWVCMDCRAAGRTKNFFLPVNEYPENGCPVCGSHQILDFNVSPVTLIVGGYG